MSYIIGIDFGTLSGRAALVDAANGHIAAAAEYDYPHGVMDTALPWGTPLKPDWALQHPGDYLAVMENTLPRLFENSGVRPQQVAGIALDVTASTVLPARADGTPLCFLDEYKNEPHAYAKLWKHHAAQSQANRMTQMALERREEWLAAYGGKVSSEWALPKLWQVLEEAPQVYAATEAWVEAADWIVWQLCGVRVQNSCAAGYKSFYVQGKGFPGEDYFAALDERLRHVVREKLSAPVAPVFSRAGFLTKEMAQRLGLPAGITVGVGGVDAHVCVPAAGITQPGKLLAIIGTSTCHMAVSDVRRQVPGICGVVAEGILPGLWGYESGQCCVGDHYAWLTRHFVPRSYQEEAERRGLSLHQYLTQLASALKPGESGLMALDWWNGNRSILVDGDLTGLLMGLTLQTRPEEIYRALMEATAYGMRVVIENYRAHGVPVEEVYALGGISQKNSFMMQTYGDILGCPIQVVDCPQGGALGSAIMGAVAAGLYPTAAAAIERMAAPVSRVYTPIPAHQERYHELFQIYKELHDLFGRGGTDAMKRLKALRMKSA